MYIHKDLTYVRRSWGKKLKLYFNPWTYITPEKWVLYVKKNFLIFKQKIDIFMMLEMIFKTRHATLNCK